MNLFEILIGQIPEAIYFALFIVFTKRLKEKRLLFIALMIIEYLLLKLSLPFSSYFQIGYTIMTFITLKVLYKERAQITDVFTFGIASLILILISIITFITLHQYTLIAAIFNRILMILFIIIFKNKLYKIQEMYKKLWNRNDKTKHKIKSTTFRCINVVLFNLMFYTINLGMVFAIFMRR